MHGAGRVKIKNPILADKQSQDKNHDFHRDASFTLIKQITNVFTTIAKLYLP